MFMMRPQALFNSQNYSTLSDDFLFWRLVFGAFNEWTNVRLTSNENENGAHVLCSQRLASTSILRIFLERKTVHRNYCFFAIHMLCVLTLGCCVFLIFGDISKTVRSVNSAVILIKDDVKCNNYSAQLEYQAYAYHISHTHVQLYNAHTSSVPP